MLDFEKKKEIAKTLVEGMFEAFDPVKPIKLEEVMAILGMALFAFCSMISDKVAEVEKD